MPALPTWAAQKLGPLPVWGWGALAMSGGVGFVLYKRHRAASSSGPTLGGAAQAVPAKYPNASGDSAGGGGGGPGGGPDTLSPGGGTIETTAPATHDQPATVKPIGQQAAALLPGGYQGAPAVQIAPSLLGGGYLASQTQLQNPAGSANRDALASYNPATGIQSYTPSLTDYASEQPGGIPFAQAGLPGTQPNQGLTYSIYGTNTGTGPVVAAGDRKAGERYDASGRVIL